jgi:hypothetical protein
VDAALEAGFVDRAHLGDAARAPISGPGSSTPYISVLMP